MRLTRGVLVALPVMIALLVAAIAVTQLHAHRPSRASGSNTDQAALVARLAILRRPQTAADRGFFHVRGIAHATVVRRLVRLAGTVGTPTLGRVRLYVVVRRSHPLFKSTRAGEAQALAMAVAVKDDRVVLVSPPVAAGAIIPAATMSGRDIWGYGTTLSTGLTLGLVPDGVNRVSWTYSGIRYGIAAPHPTTHQARVLANVAVSPFLESEGPLQHAAWYGQSGRVIATAQAGGTSRLQIQQIRAVNRTKNRPIARYLITNFALFRNSPADSPAQDPRLRTFPSDGYAASLGLNYFQTRYVPDVEGLDGRGLWITPGEKGLCISDSKASSCGRFSTHHGPTLLGATTAAGHRETLAGITPDGNRDVILLLANGATRNVPVVDHNVWEATVTGRVRAIISRNIHGETTRQRLG